MRRLLLLSIALLGVVSARALTGDVNGDGFVTSADVTALYDYLLNDDASNIVKGDVNNDGVITSADVTSVYEILLNGTPLVVTEYEVNGVKFKMVDVDTGTFMIGASDNDPNAEDLEKPAHQVSLSAFKIGQTEVTQALWQAVMGSNPSHFTGANLPVENVTWQECMEFVYKIRKLTGLSFRLPTEAEWEYAARGGQRSKGYLYSGNNTIGNVAWYTGNSSSKTHAVGSKTPNELGIYDMSGNVREWCYDWLWYYDSEPEANPSRYFYSGADRACRGGGWNSPATQNRVSYRKVEDILNHDNQTGLRLVLENSEFLNIDEDGYYEYLLMAVEGGTFMMGSSDDDPDGRANEKPAHQAKVSSFKIGQTEVPQMLWEAVMGSNPSYFDSFGDLNPVEMVSWEDCQLFAAKLSKMTGRQFRLPTEAEWEFAARGGNFSLGYKYSGSDDIDDVAWYEENSGYSTNPIYTKWANELCLFDMSGNVWEWCVDNQGTYTSEPQVDPWGKVAGLQARVCRGGAYFNNPNLCRPASRAHDTPEAKDKMTGLRLVLDDSEYDINGVKFKMINVMGGTFTMGGTGVDVSSTHDEKPLHEVTLDFYRIGETEVTQELWQAVMGSNPSEHIGANLPVENVSWYDCQEFISKLNILTGRHFRLPTEAEWEYAARGGLLNEGNNDYSGAEGLALGEVSWYYWNSNETPHPVATKLPNELGLYDMSGNVWEWCSDWYGSYSAEAQANPQGPATGSYKVYRGGSYNDDGQHSRVSCRANWSPSSQMSNVGFRLAE